MAPRRFACRRELSWLAVVPSAAEGPLTLHGANSAANAGLDVTISVDITIAARTARCASGLLNLVIRGFRLHTVRRHGGAPGAGVAMPSFGKELRNGPAGPCPLKLGWVVRGFPLRLKAFGG